MANPFAKFSQQKEAAQQEVEAKLTGTAKRGRPRKRKDATTLNVLLAGDDKRMLTELAEAESLGMNDLITRWIRKEYKAWEKGQDENRDIVFTKGGNHD